MFIFWLLVLVISLLFFFFFEVEVHEKVLLKKTTALKSEWVGDLNFIWLFLSNLIYLNSLESKSDISW